MDFDQAEVFFDRCLHEDKDMASDEALRNGKLKASLLHLPMIYSILSKM